MHIYDMIFLLSLFNNFSSKPIRFGGYKNWVLTSANGYKYETISYQVKAMGTDRGPLGPRAVNSLLKVVENPACHEVFFDNFFYFCWFVEKSTYSGYPGYWDKDALL